MTTADVLAGPGAEHTPVVLLVEDEVLVRLATAEMLRDEGYTVLEAADASEALTLFHSGHPLDVVVSDVRMPGDMDGLALSAALKEARPNLPVLLVSGNLHPNDVHAADGFLAKPFLERAFLTIVKDLIDPEWKSNRTRHAAS